MIPGLFGTGETLTAPKSISMITIKNYIEWERKSERERYQSHNQTQITVIEFNL